MQCRTYEKVTLRMELEPCEVGSNRVTFLWCVTYEKVTFGQLPEFCVPEMWDRRNGAYKKPHKASHYPIKGEIGQTGPTKLNLSACTLERVTRRR